MDVCQDLPWIVELDMLGSFADLDELRSLHESIPETNKNHPTAKWLEGWIHSRFTSEELGMPM